MHGAHKERPYGQSPLLRPACEAQNPTQIAQDMGFYRDWVLPAWLSDSGVRMADFYMRAVPPRKYFKVGIFWEASFPAGKLHVASRTPIEALNLELRILNRTCHGRTGDE